MAISKVEEMLKKPLSERAALKHQIHKVTIQGNVFEDYGEFSFFYEKTYQKEPTRSISGVISNLDTMATFLVPHLKIKYSLLSLEDYRRLANLMISRNEFAVTCYDAVGGTNVTNNMYFLPDQMPQFLSIAHQAESGNWSEIVGVKEYTIEMVGTLSEYENKDITIKYKFPSGVSFDYNLDPSEATLQFGSQIVVGGLKIDESTNLKNGTVLTDKNGGKYEFVGWRTANSSAKYLDGEEYAFFKDTTLFAILQTIW